MHNYNYKYKVTINILQKKQYFVQFDIDKRFLIMPKKSRFFFAIQLYIIILKLYSYINMVIQCDNFIFCYQKRFLEFQINNIVLDGTY